MMRKNKRTASYIVRNREMAVKIEEPGLGFAGEDGD